MTTNSMSLDTMQIRINPDDTITLTQIDPNWIESMNVLRPENAIEKYGAEGEFGVIFMRLKKEYLDSIPEVLIRKFNL